MSNNPDNSVLIAKDRLDAADWKRSNPQHRHHHTVTTLLHLRGLTIRGEITETPSAPENDHYATLVQAAIARKQSNSIDDNLIAGTILITMTVDADGKKEFATDITATVDDRLSLADGFAMLKFGELDLMDYADNDE